VELDMKQINKSPSYLVRNSYSYCFRLVIPEDLKPYFGKKELRYSLKTGYIDEAKIKARFLAGNVQSIFRILRRGTMVNLSDDRIKELVNTYIKESVERINNWFLDDTNEFPPYTNEPEFYSYISELDGIKQDLIANLNMGNYVMLENTINNFLKSQGIDIDKESSAYKKLCVGIHQAEINLIPIQKRHMLNDLSYKDELPDIFPEVFDRLSEERKEPVPEQLPKEKPSPTLRKAIDDYKKRQLELNKWNPNTVRNYQPKINIMLQVFGNRPVNQITKNDARKLAQLLELLPPRFALKKEYKDISGLDPKDLKGKHDKTMDVTTRRGYLIFARQVFSFAEDNEWVIKNPVISGIIPGKKDNPREQRLPFDDPEDLARIFNPKIYLKWSKDHPSRFWIPLLALYTGCRLEEMASLYCEDVFEYKGLWCIDINDDNDRQVKNKNAIRSVPLHPFLVEQLRFPQYAKMIEAKGSKRVFPDLKKENHKYGNVLSKRFNYYLRNKVGIKDKEKTFHSFRHNVTNCLMNETRNESMVEELSGRAGKTETRRTYFKGFRSDVLYKECVSKLKYKVDLSHLKDSKYVPKK
jgi:integrase